MVQLKVNMSLSSTNSKKERVKVWTWLVIIFSLVMYVGCLPVCVAFVYCNVHVLLHKKTEDFNSRCEINTLNS